MRSHGLSGDHCRYGGVEENTFGTCVGRSGWHDELRALSTDDRRGVGARLHGRGRFTDDPLETFGALGVAEIPQLQKLLKYICREDSSTTWPRISATCPSRARIARYLGWRAISIPRSKSSCASHRQSVQQKRPARAFSLIQQKRLRQV